MDDGDVKISTSTDNKKHPHLTKPTICQVQNYNENNDMLWFNVKNTGNFAAKNIKITLLLENEKTDIIDILKNRTISKQHLQSGETFTYGLPMGRISFNDLHTKYNKIYRFLVLLEYSSEYSKNKYKRIFLLESAGVKIDEKKQTNWDTAINFYEIHETHYKICKKINLLKNVRGYIFKHFLKMIPVDIWYDYYWASR